MKTSIFAMASLLFLTNASAAKLQELSDDLVPASLVESLDVTHASDSKVTARMLSVYRGAAAGMSSIVVTLLDNGPSQGDYSNTHSYEFSHITAGPKNISLVKVAERKYKLGFDATEVSLKDNGSFSYTKKRVLLNVTLDKEGAVVSVE